MDTLTFLDKDIQLVLASDKMPADEQIPKEYEELVNKKISEIPEHIVILKCTYKDGSWFGQREKTTVIGLSITGLSTAYLSKARRRELNDYFAW